MPISKENLLTGLLDLELEYSTGFDELLYTYIWLLLMVLFTAFIKSAMLGSLDDTFTIFTIILQ